jgi:excisionase family DNA binding protein
MIGLLSPRAVAGLLGVSHRTIVAWARRGELPCVVLKRGRDGRASVLRFKKQDLDEWIEARQERGASR